ncbi:MAG: MFS transporter [Alphaproteobacteria bacterium]
MGEASIDKKLDAAEPDGHLAVVGRRTPTLVTKLAYGVGSVAFGVKDTGFNFFLLLFYSQVIGVDARLVGLALTAALVIDAVTDPLVGYWSDNFRSRWGRRHLFMYASAIPVALSYFLLWNPPKGLDVGAMFWYLLVLAVATRVCITFFEVPSAAQAPELTQGYDERSTLMSYRSFFGWAGGNATTVLMFFFLFPAFTTAAIPQGQFNRDAYVVYGIIAAGLMLASILVSAAGTQSYVSDLQRPPVRRLTLIAGLREIWETLASRSFLALFVATIFGFVATGLASALSIYFSTYFWGFTAQQIGGITLAVFVSALVGAMMAPWATRLMGKKRGAMVVGVAGLVVSPLAVLLHLVGVLSSGRDPGTFWTVFLLGQIDVALTVCFQALTASMIADLVEQSELKTGRRSEGVFFAANTFIQKMVSGVGVMAAALVLTLAHFPANATTQTVSDDVLQRLGWWYLPAMALLRLGMLGAMAMYSLSRADHADNLRRLEKVERAL